MRPTLLILLLTAPFARADISFVSPMRQALLLTAIPATAQTQNNGWTHSRLTNIEGKPISFYSNSQM